MSFFKKIFNNSEDFKNYVIAISLIFGGIWTFWTFNAALQVKNAEAELSLLKRQIKEAENKLKVNITLDIDISFRYPKPNSNLNNTVIAKVEITNHGTDNIFLNLGHKPLRISSYNRDSQGNVTFGEPILLSAYDYSFGDSIMLNNIIPLDVLLVSVGDTDFLEFVIQVPKPGIYFVVFSAFTKDLKWPWQRGRFIFIEK